MLESGLVGIVGTYKVALSMKSSAFAAPALGPVGFDVGGLVGVVQSVVPLALRGVGGGTVGVEDVVFGLDLDGLGEIVAEW